MLLHVVRCRRVQEVLLVGGSIHRRRLLLLVAWRVLTPRVTTVIALDSGAHDLVHTSVLGMGGSNWARWMLVSSWVVRHLLIVLLMLGHRHIILILLLGWITTIHLLLLLHHATLLTAHFRGTSSLTLLWKAAWVSPSGLFAAHLISATILRTLHPRMHHGHSVILLPARYTEAVRHICRKRIAGPWKSLLLLIKSLRLASRGRLLTDWLGEYSTRHLLLLLLLRVLDLLVELLLLLNHWRMALSRRASTSWNFWKLNLSCIRILKIWVTFKGSIQLLTMHVWVRTSIEIRIALLIVTLHLKRFIVSTRTSPTTRGTLILILVL